MLLLVCFLIVLACTGFAEGATAKYGSRWETQSTTPYPYWRTTRTTSYPYRRSTRATTYPYWRTTGTTPYPYWRTTGTTPYPYWRTTGTTSYPYWRTTGTTSYPYWRTTGTTPYPYWRTTGTTPYPYWRTTGTTSYPYWRTTRTTPYPYWRTTGTIPYPYWRSTRKASYPYWRSTRTTPYPYWRTTGTTPYPYWRSTRKASYPYWRSTRTTPYPYWRTTGTTPYPYWRTTGTTPYPYWRTTGTPYPYWRTTGTTPYPYWQSTRTTPYPYWRSTRTTPYPYWQTTIPTTSPYETSTKKKSADVTIVADPSLIKIGITNSLTVKCSLDHVPKDFANLISLVLWTYAGPNKAQLTELVGVNAFQPDRMNVIGELHGGVASGRITPGSNTQPFIQVHWEYPSETEGTVYVCEANALTVRGHSVRLSSSTEVHSQSAQSKADLLQQLRVIGSDNRKLKESNAALLEENTLLKKDAFIVSKEFQHRKYYLSKCQSLSANESVSLCESLGGTLAEISDANEYNFIKNFVYDRLMEDPAGVFISGTDEASEGRWVYQDSEVPVAILDWSPADPVNPREEGRDCLQLVSVEHAVRMRATRCGADMSSSFLCEVKL